MKRFFFSLIALAAAAVSCTQSALLETPTLDGTPVSFSPYTGRTPVTKATSIADEAGLNAEGGFFVYSFLNQPNKDKSLYLNANVKMTEGVWSYDNTVYWPATEGSTLDFVAYSANGVNKGLVLDGTDGFTFTVQDDVNNQVDLLATAYQERKTATSEGVSGGDVTLKFFHLLSRVGFKVQTGSTKAFTIKSLSITGDTPTKGTLAFTDFTGDAVPALTPEAVVEDKAYFFVNSDAVMAGGASDATAITGMDSKYLMLMPHDAAGHTISITYTIGNSEKTATAQLPADFEFEQGKAYEFILKISTSALTFDVTEEEWNETGDTDLQPEPEVTLVTSTTYPSGTLELLDITESAARLQFKASVKIADVAPGDGEAYDEKHIGAAYRIKGNTSWINIEAAYRGGTVNKNATIVFSLPEFAPNIVYECCMYYESRGYELYEYEKPFLNTTIKTTGAKFTTDWYTSYGIEYWIGENGSYPTEPIPGEQQYLIFTYKLEAENDSTEEFETPIVTIESISAATSEATVTGSYIEGSSPITNYGFCWMSGAGTPTTSNSKKECTSSFSHTITSLAEGVYSCRAYVITKDGETYYSQVRTIEIEPATDEGDNTGGGNWEDDTEIEF